MPRSRLHSGGKHGSVALVEAARTSIVPCIAGFCLLLLATLVTSGVRAQDCIDYRNYLHWVGTLGTSGDLAAAGDYAYVAGGNLKIVHLSYQGFPIVVSEVGTPHARSVAVAGSYAYVGGGPLSVVNISEPTAPRIVGSAELPGETTAVAVDGSHAYLINTDLGFVVVDISDPAAPAIRSSIGAPGDATGVAASGSHAYVVDSVGLHVIDVSVPAAPVIIGSVSTPGDAIRVAVAGDHAYVADGEPGLQVVDISTPTSPVIINNVNTPWRANDVVVEEDYAYVADGSSGLQVVDISTPPAAVIIASIDTPGDAIRVAVAGGYACVGCFGWYGALTGLLVVDVSNLNPPPVVGGVDTPGSAHDVVVTGEYACVADGSSGLQVVDISTPPAAVIVGSVGTPGGASCVAAEGDRVFVADGNLQVVDISIPELPRIAATLDIPGMAHQVAVIGDHVCASLAGFVGERAWLHVVDTDRQPPLAGSVSTPGSAKDVAVAGAYAYVADGAGGLQIIEVIDPTSAGIVGSVSTYGNAWSVVVDGGCAYLGERVHELPYFARFLEIFDVNAPTGPALLGSVSEPYIEGLDVALAGHHAYVAYRHFHNSGLSGLRVVDVSDPTAPAIVSGINTPGDASAVAVAGSYVYVADGESGLQVISISDPTVPEIVGGVETPGRASDVALTGGYAYLADRSAGLQIVDIRNPTAPSVVASVAIGDAMRVMVTGHYAYVANAGEGVGVCVIDISVPTAPVLVNCDHTGDEPQGLAAAGDHVYMADSGHGLRILNVEGLLNPPIIGSVELPGVLVWDLAVVGDYVYVVDGGLDDGWLGVVDVSDPRAPTVVAWDRMWGPALGVAVVGEYASVVGLSPHGARVQIPHLYLQVVDISNPAAPATVGGAGYLAPGVTWDVGVTVDNGYVYAAVGRLLQVVDVSTPTTPVIIGSSPIPSSAVAVAGDLAYVAGGEAGLIILPAHCELPTPVRLVSCEITVDDSEVAIAWETSFEAMHLGFHVERAEGESGSFARVNTELIRAAAARRYEFVDRSVTPGQAYDYRLVAVDFGGGTQTFSIGSIRVGGTPPAAILLFQNRPNPFTRSTEIPFSITAPGPVTLGVYDVTGRLVRSLLARQAMAMGEHHISWDGRDSSGRAVATGTYFYRLHVGGKEIERKLQILR